MKSGGWGGRKMGKWLEHIILICLAIIIIVLCAALALTIFLTSGRAEGTGSAISCTPASHRHYPCPFVNTLIFPRGQGSAYAKNG